MKRTLRTFLIVCLSMALVLSFSLYPVAADTTSATENALTETETHIIWHYNYETGESRYETVEINQDLYAMAAQTVQTRPAYCPPNLINDLGSSVATRGVPSDQSTVRAHSYPYCAAGNVEFVADTNNNGEFDEDWGGGTAFLVAEDIILTAAHCVFHEEGTAVNAYFYPAQQSSSDSYREIYKSRIKGFAFSVDYIGSQEPNQDWAICQIANNRGDTFGWFGLSSSAGVYTGLSLTALGYPGDLGGSQSVIEGCPYKSTGTVNSILSTMRFKATNYVQQGYSGGPMYDSDGLVYGIISRELTTNGITNTIAMQFPTWLFNEIIEHCDASEARWS